ncbi:MAG: PseG/SpsG family protein [Alishewanella aestuarii]
MKALFLTEGSSQVGFGHVTRCLSLYQALELFGGDPFFMIKGDNSIGEVLKGAKYQIFDWISGWRTIRGILKNFDLVVLDSYLAGMEIYEDISNLLKTKLYIDDYLRLEYPAGIVLNGSIYAKELPYPKRQGLIYLLGIEYIPLRRAFWSVKPKYYREKLKKILITFGGDDLRNMTPKIIKALQRAYPHLELLVVVGGGFKGVKEIEGLKNSNLRLFYKVDAEGMKSLMLDADVAISAGGQTTYELARVGVPSILVAVAENQLLNCVSFEKRGIALYAGWWQDENLVEKIIQFLELLRDKEVRERMGKLGRKNLDGKGSIRVADFLKKNTSPPSSP